MAEEGMQETPNKLIHIGKPIEMDDAAFKKKLRQLDEAAYQETDRMKRLVAEVVSSGKWQTCKSKRGIEMKKKRRITTDMPRMKKADPFYRDQVKRILDLLIAIPVFIVALIPMIIIAIAVKIDSPGPVLFKQERLGKDGKVFLMLKFRSMCVGAEHKGSGVYSGKGDTRVTKVGKIIRATSLDELPQLINVLRGDMSLIGPRPPLTYHPWPIEEYTKEQLHMFDVRPGFSGWAQIHGRKDVEWNHRIELNVWYVKHVRFSLDLRIFLTTIFKVLLNKDNENKGETLKK